MYEAKFVDEHRSAMAPPTKEFKTFSLNQRLRSCNCKEVTLEDVVASKDSEDIVERKIGIWSFSFVWFV